MRAHGFEAGLAYRALAAAVREWHDHEITWLNGFDRRANLFDHTDGLVAHLTVRGLSAQPTEEPQIRAAYTGAHHANYDVIILLKCRLWHFFHGHLARLNENRGFHGFRHIHNSLFPAPSD